MQLDCVAQNYAWGKRGLDSSVAKFRTASAGVDQIAPAECYAELWMGTHPSGASKIHGTGTPLLEWLRKHPSSVGTVPDGYPSDDLPFLFKVLSVETALSIQTHPDKELAADLHLRFPDIYKDPNHKPEMVIALTPFECLCGFRTLAEIAEHFTAYPEFRGVVDHNGPVSKLANSSAEDEATALRSIFSAFMTCPADIYTPALSAMIERLSAATGVTAAPSALDALLLRLNKQYPSDIGVFAPLIMNAVHLQPGQSFFIGANELHAYVSGECIECMALSDNVVRAGLTPKFKDCETLGKMLRYKAQVPSFLTPIPLDDCTSLYRPPADCCAEFEVERIEIPAHTTGYHPLRVDCGSILLLQNVGEWQSTAAETVQTEVRLTTVPEGEQRETTLDLPVGAVVYTSAGQDVSISTGAGGAVFYRAHVNLGGR